MHTGLVVVGDMGGAGRYESLALGEVPNIGSRIEGLAAPNTIAVSEATYRLIQGYFECQDLGAQTLRGVGEPITVYRVLSESGAQSRLDIASARGLTPLVGREQEVGLLVERWEQVKAGHGHVVLLTGDGGLGKSRLVQTLKDHVANEPHTRWECRSLPYYQNTALYPIVDLLQRTVRFAPQETPEARLEQLERVLSQYRQPLEETVPLFAPLLALPVPDDRYPPLTLSPQRQRQKTLETIVAILLELAAQQPVLFIVEDLQWTDPTTLELLNLVLDQTPTVALLTVLTCRPTFQPPWSHRSYLSEVTVSRLSQPQIERMVERVAGSKTFPEQVSRLIVEKTDGVPLFVEELTKAILESGQLTAVDEHYELSGSLSTFAIPATLQDSLMARLDRLVTAKGVAQYAAVIGRQFAYDLLSTVSQLDEATLQRELGRLVGFDHRIGHFRPLRIIGTTPNSSALNGLGASTWDRSRWGGRRHDQGRLVEAEIVFQRGLPPQSAYVFKHALIQDAAYQSLLKSTRQHYHQRIAQVLEAQFPETVEAQPELLAHHYTEAGLTEKAVHYWHQAGQRAIERSAHVEAISHLRRGLALLQTLPKTPEGTQREVDMLLVLGASLVATEGYAAPEVGETYTYARQLCDYLEDPHQLFPVLRGLWSYYSVRAEHQTAHALGEQLLALAQQVQDATMLMAAHQALGRTLFQLGAFTSAHTHFAQGIALYDPQQHYASAFLYGDNPCVACAGLDAWTLWYLGYPDQGLVRLHEAVTLAQQMAHPFSLCFALNVAAWFHQFCREVHAAQEYAEVAISLATEKGFPVLRERGIVVHGWALAQQGQAKEGIEQITQGLIAHRATGAAILRPCFLSFIAEAYGTLGQSEAGLTVLTEALTLALAETTGEPWYAPELYRLKGELLLQQSSDNQVEAEVCFHKAIDIARSQQAKSFELRAATSLARLWQQQGKRQEAHDLLAPVYNWFTEGFDTADLQEAKALLEALA
jgi:predicted ATPase